MYWTRIFIPILRDEPAGANSETHRLLIRAGYMRGRDYLLLGRRALRRIAGVIRAEMDAIGAQEVLFSGPARAVAAELRSYRQVPQIWYQLSGLRLRSHCFDLSENAFRSMSAAVRAALDRCGATRPPAVPEVFADPEGGFAPEEFHTPAQKSIADITSFTGRPPTSQIKTLVVVAGSETVLALVRGDHQLDPEKLAWYLDARDLRPARAEEIREAFGADAGSLGPIGVEARVVADEALRGRRDLICGANRNDYHLRHVTPGRDFHPEFHDIRERPGQEIVRMRQAASPLLVSNEDARMTALTEGVCEVYLDRLLEAAARHDGDGLVLPSSIAPFSALITPVNIADEAQRRAAADLHDAAPFDALLDDRDERPGVKFKDADLTGIPFRITLGKKLAQGVVEIRNRAARTSEDVALGEALAFVAGQRK